MFQPALLGWRRLGGAIARGLGAAALGAAAWTGGAAVRAADGPIVSIVEAPFPGSAASEASQPGGPAGAAPHRQSAAAPSAWPALQFAPAPAPHGLPAPPVLPTPPAASPAVGPAPELEAVREGLSFEAPLGPLAPPVRLAPTPPQERLLPPPAPAWMLDAGAPAPAADGGAEGGLAPIVDAAEFDGLPPVIDAAALLEPLPQPAAPTAAPVRGVSVSASDVRDLREWSPLAPRTQQLAPPPAPGRGGTLPIVRQAQPPAVLEMIEPLGSGEPLPPLAGDDDFRPIQALGTEIRPTAGELPTDYAAARFASAGGYYEAMGGSRPWIMSDYRWVAPSLCHRPLYFEEPNLERYGYSYGVLQPAVSTAHFFGRVAILPYLMGAYPTRECIYELGYYRPGSNAPYRLSREPFSARGLVYQGVVTSGIFFFLP